MNGLLTEDEINSLIKFLKDVGSHANFLTNKMPTGKKANSVYDLWLSQNGFVEVINYNYGQMNWWLMKFTDKGRRLVKAGSYKKFLRLEWIDNHIKYAPLIAIVISVLSLVTSVAFHYTGVISDKNHSNREQLQIQEINRKIEANKVETSRMVDSLCR